MSTHHQLLQGAPQEFVEFLKREGIRKCFFVYDAEHACVISSHPQLKPIAQFFQEDIRDFMQHEGMFFKFRRSMIRCKGCLSIVPIADRGPAVCGTGIIRAWKMFCVTVYACQKG